MKKTLSHLLLIIGIIASCTESQNNTSKEVSREIDKPTNQVKLSSEVVWEQLNPARGDKSPLAGTLWGDRKADVATGYLGKFIDGFSSPPHIHNVSYRAIVIKGSMHNDDPEAEKMWMKPGSFWTQPQGEAHITAARGEENIAYIEIDQGPYLVKPTKEAFDNGERPINIDASNIIWLGSDQLNWIDSKSKIKASFLWESKTNSGLRGLFVKLPKGSRGVIESDGAIFYSIVIRGGIHYQMPKTDETKTLDEGSCFSAKNSAIHRISNDSNSDAILYIRTSGGLLIQ